MILSAQSIRARGIFTPFRERTVAFGMTYGLGPAGYDVRIAESLWIEPGGRALASTIEQFKMPDDLLGHVADKSTWARRFLTVQNTIIEPGWRGYLTLELTNHNDVGVRIESGMPIAQIILHLLDTTTEQPYNGKYQDQPSGAVGPLASVSHIRRVESDELVCSCGLRWSRDEDDPHDHAPHHSS